MKRSLIVFLYSISVLSSCEKVLIPKDLSDNPESIFNELWTTIDRGYSFFDYKNINWDSFYQVYRPRIREQMSERELFDVCASMLSVLKDGHVNLRSGFTTAYYNNFYLDYPPNFNRELLDRTYLRGFEVTGPLYHSIFDSVGYIYYGSFQMPVSDDQLDAVINRFQSYQVKGVIIDVRNNGGGNPANGYRILRRLAKERSLLYETIYKDGPGHEDFSEPKQSFIEPTEKVKFSGKIAVLTNRKCYSACNFFVAAVTAFPQVRTFGDITGGGGGQPTGYQLANGWGVNFSSSITYLPNGFIIENGVPPDVFISLQPADESRGIDTIIEAAKRFVSN